MTSTPSYVLEQSQEELDRLSFVSELLAPAVRETCQRAGLVAGGRALDVGCGPLGALPTLANLVGVEGAVVGVDADPVALDAARRNLDAAGHDRVALVHCDANELTPEAVGASGFDLAFCRLVLMHQPDPGFTMARIAGLLRPGGSLVAIDFFAPPVCEPAHPAVARAWELVIEAMRVRGASPGAARRYRALCAAAGLEVVSERGVFVPIPAVAVVSEAAVLLNGARPTVESAGLCPASEFDRLLDQLRVERVDPGVTAYSPQTVELVARVPLGRQEEGDRR